MDKEADQRPERFADLQPTQTFSNDYEKVLPGHYRLIELLGRGGMAEVFLAEDTRLSRRVAIKFLNSEFRKDPDRMRRFHREARAASALNHPNILIIHDIGENEGIQYLVSEFVQGEPLSSRISRGTLPLAEAVDIAIQIASALAASHHAGIVHRDIKPDNVMLRPDGSVKVLDFGLAKDTGSLSRALELDANTVDDVSTSPGLIMGTPQYMSPEQARGTQLDPRTDIFSLGIIIFEMVTGSSPFAGTTMADTIAAILTKEPERLDQFLDDPPSTLSHIVQTALRKDREERYNSMELLLSDLRDLQRELAAQPYAERRTVVTHAIATRRNTLSTVARRFMHWEPMLLVFPILLLGGIAWWYFGGVRQSESLIQGSMRSIGITSWSSRPGEVTAAASFSPDARMVAFASTQSGASEIWVKPTAGGDAVQVTKNGSGNQYPVWSPDGQAIAFFSNRSGSPGIWRAAFTGGAQTQILTGVGATAKPVYWSKSGKIYFQEGSELFSVEEQTNKKNRVTNFESKGLNPRTVEISADESSIAYSLQENDVWKVKLERLDAGTTVELGSSKDQIDNMAWHPNGRIVFFSTSVDGAYQIFQAGEGYASPVQLSNGNSDFYVQDISSDGSKILYGSVSETSDLWSADIERTKESLVANDVEAEYWAEISPDGTNVVYQSVNQTDRAYSGSIKVRSLSGEATPTLISPTGFSPVWAPNGEWIAFFKKLETGFEIWRSKPSGGEAVKLAGGGVHPLEYTATPYLKVGINHISWSPNSEAVAYSARTDGVSNIWLASSDGSRNTMLTANKNATEPYCCPTWTPDGKSFLFTSFYVPPESQQAVYRLWQLVVEGAEQRLVWESKERFRFLGLDETGNNAVIAQRADPADLASTPALTYVYSVAIKTGAKLKVNTISDAYFHNIHLSRDGRTIAFASRRDNSTALWIVPVAGGSPRKLLDEKDPKVLISSLSWSPDGRSIVFGKQTRTTLLSMLAK
jgi:serine/threonine protein kinase/Tol biopolymer transport system component